MYTGYYAKAKHYADCGLVPVAISLHPPVWFDGLRYPLLAPSASILNGYRYGNFKDDTGHYVRRFTEEILGRLDREKVKRDLTYLTGTDCTKIVLLCFERPGDFCHRHIVASWLGDCTEYEVAHAGTPMTRVGNLV